MEGTDLSCAGKEYGDCEGEDCRRRLESGEDDQPEEKKEEVCIPMQGDDDIVFDSICIDGVMYSDHFCNTSVMGMMVLIGMMAAGLIGVCGLRLFALPVFLRCFKLCCKCCFHDDEHVRGAFAHMQKTKRKMSRQITLS